MGLGTTITVVVGIAGLGLGAMEVPEIHDRVFTPKRSEVKRVVTLLDSSLGEAAKGRTTMITVNKSVNNCWPKTTPATAAETVRKLVRKNRAFVRAEVSSIGPTTDSDAQELVDAFREAYTRSERVDQDYENWLRTWDKQRDGCKPRFSGSAWNAYNEDNESATTAKVLFLKLYNEPARKYGLRQRKLTEI